MIAGRDTFSDALDALLDCPIVVDRWPDRGPLGGLLSAADETRRHDLRTCGRCAAGRRRVIDTLLDAWQHGDEAVVPEHGGRLEPLAALYDREAFMREALGMSAWRGSLDACAARTLARTQGSLRRAHVFANINTSADLAQLAETP